MTDHEGKHHLLLEVDARWLPGHSELTPHRAQARGIGKDARILGVGHGVGLTEICPPFAALELRAVCRCRRRVLATEANRGIPDNAR